MHYVAHKDTHIPLKQDHTQPRRVVLMTPSFLTYDPVHSVLRFRKVPLVKRRSLIAASSQASSIEPMQENRGQTDRMRLN